MKSIRKVIGATAALCLAVVAASSSEQANGDELKNELAQLKGTWVRELNGKTYVISFDGDKFATRFEFVKGIISTSSGTIAIDPRKKPKQMDCKFAEGEKLKGKTQLTIYQLDADKLRFCAWRQQGRPEDFPDKEVVGTYIYLVFKRCDLTR